MNILVTGYRLVSQSITSLLDAAFTASDLDTVTGVLDGLRTDQVAFTALRTRQSGHYRFISLGVQVPGTWIIDHGDQVTQTITTALTTALPGVEVQTWLTPRRSGPGG